VNRGIVLGRAIRIILYISCNQGLSQDILMQVMAFTVLSLVGMGVVAALSAALYAALPRSFLESAELHGRFQGLQQDKLIPNGTPLDAMPEGALGGQAA
jgi:hypothetical protein